MTSTTKEIKKKIIMRAWRSCAIALLAAVGCCAQQSDAGSGDVVVQPSATLTSQILDHDFVNYFLFGNGTYDTNLPVIRNGASTYGGAFGWDVGGGVTASHSFKGGEFSLSYRGDYRHYNSNGYGNGNTQNLSLLFNKQLSRRWAVGFSLGGGILEYGGSFYSMEPTNASTDITNPLASRSRFASAGVNVTYSQTRRLSYVFSGAGFYSSYNYSGAARSLGGTGTASVQYRTTARTTIGGTYSHSYYTYSSNFGSSTIDGGFLTLSHMFSGHWSANLSAGETHSHSQGTITLPVTLLLGQQLVSGYITGPYNRSANTPSFQLGVSHYLKRSSVSLTGGQGVNAGNGTYLTSKDQFVTLTLSFSHRLSNFGLGGSYFRLTSIANTVSNTYSSANFSASYGYTLKKYIALNFRYDFIHYDNFYALQGVNESRVSLGVSFSSKSVPLTLF
jgi:hypothetical protein